MAATAAGAIAFGMLWGPWVVVSEAPAYAVNGFGHLPGFLARVPGIGLWYVFAAACAVLTVVDGLVWLLRRDAVVARALPCVAAAGAILAFVSGLVMKGAATSALSSTATPGLNLPPIVLGWGWGFYLCVFFLVVAAVAGVVVARGARVANPVSFAA